MGVAEIIPSGVPGRRFYIAATSSARVTYRPSKAARYVVRIPAPAPAELQVDLEFGREDGGVWAHVPELDVSAEGSDVNEAFSNVVAAVRDWLSYLRDERPQLAPELEGQQRYVDLLDAPVFSWFKDFRFAE